MHRKPAALLCRCSSGTNHHHHPPSAATLTRPPRRPYSSAPTPSSASPDDPSLSWPSVPPHATPTPYQILSATPGTPYTKTRFAQLVKIYHPDRNPSAAPHLNPSRCSRAVMLERYRLIVAAHTLLADADARAAYDRSGAGWARPRTAGAQGKWSTTHRWRDSASRASVDDDPMFCATWEDWEAWHARRRGEGEAGYFTPRMGRQGQIFASNYTFLSLVALLAALGGIGQATRAHAGAQRGVERARAVSEENGRVLMQARQDTKDWESSGEGKRERIRRFLREREQYGEGEFDARAGASGDEAMCAPGATGDRGEAPFWKKPPEI